MLRKMKMKAPGCVATITALRHTESIADLEEFMSTQSLLATKYCTSFTVATSPWLYCSSFHLFQREIPLLVISQWPYSLLLLMQLYYCFPECINYCKKLPSSVLPFKN